MSASYEGIDSVVMVLVKNFKLVWNIDLTIIDNSLTFQSFGNREYIEIYYSYKIDLSLKRKYQMSICSHIDRVGKLFYKKEVAQSDNRLSIIKSFKRVHVLK
jgi:hypothetical protein